MAHAPPTVTELKERFIAAQVLHLSTPLSGPSASFRGANERSATPLELRHVQSLVAATDGAVQTHCRRVFIPQATRAVAEQISDAYVKDAERRLERERGEVSGIGKEMDLTDETIIETLPVTWVCEKDTTDYPLEASRYTETMQTLTALNSQRKEIRARVERFRRLKETVDPLDTSLIAGEGGNGAGVQDNLATRNGAVEKELEKMRMLLVRVAGRVGGLKDNVGERRRRDRSGDDDGVVEPVSVARKRNIDDFLADPAVFPEI